MPQINTVSNKELAALSDLLGMEQTAYKKCKSYANSLTDPALQILFTELAQSHVKKFMALYEALD
jgi:hypothetical protein